MLAEALACGEATDADVVVFDADEYDDKTGFVTPLPMNLRAGLADRVRFTSFANCVWNKLFRASYLKANKIRFQEIARTNDLAFCVEALAKTDRIAVLPRKLYRYRINAGGLQSTKCATPDCWRSALSEAKRRLVDAGLMPRFETAFALLERQVAADNIPCSFLFSVRRIANSLRRRGLRSFVLHAIGRLLP